MNKNEIRKEIRNQRESLTQNYIDEMSEKIFENFQKIDIYKDKKNILSYMDFKNEVKTGKINKILKVLEKNIYLPKVIDKENMIAIKDNGEFYISKFGNKEPIGEEYKGDIDLIIVPGVAFDRFGNRIGFGRGYYDRFFEKYPNALKVGIAFEVQVVPEKIETEIFDKKIDMLITEKEIYRF